MRYIKLINNVSTDYSIEQLFVDYPDAVIYKNTQMPDEQLLATYDVYPLITEPLPHLGEDETAEEGIPEFREGEWHQTWTVRPLTTEESVQKKQSEEEQSARWFVDSDLAKARYSICQACNNFNKLTTQCSECNCIMFVKTKLEFATCPIGKW